MNEMISWVAQHNTLVIQVAFSIVLLLILIYVYRLFFVSSGSSSGSIESSAELGELNQKLSQLLEQQKSSGIQVIEKVVPAETTPSPTNETAVAPEAAAEGASEVEQLKAENTKLKAQLNESEKKVFELTPIAGPEDSLKETTPQVDPAQVTELNKKIDELQSRLSEYDVIADDIAELSQLRAENAELKKNLPAASAESVTPSAVEAVSPTEPAVEVEPPVVAATESTELPAIEIPEPVMEEPVAETPIAPTEEASAVTEPAAGGVPGFDAETSALLDSLVAETDAVTKTEEAPAKVEEPVAPATETAAVAEVETPAAMDQNVPEGEKNLINEFEKKIQKGS